MNRNAIKNGPQNVLAFLIFSYATVLAPFVDVAQRNYLVLVSGVIGGLAIIFYKLPITRQMLFTLALLALMIASAIRVDPIAQLASVALTSVFAAGYFAIVGLLKRTSNRRERVAKILRNLIIGFAILSVVQMTTSLLGLPIPNKLATKGMWSYNSLSIEPSHLGRVVGITMLCYLLITKESRSGETIARLISNEKVLFLSFFTTMFLSGSALAVMAIPAVILLSRSLLWGGALVAFTVLAWPLAQTIDYEPLNRAVAISNKLDTLDVNELANADASGASRIIPTLIYFQRASPSEAGFWFGYGGTGPESFLAGRIPGFGDKIAAGLIPGFFIVYGVILSALFFWIFIFRYTSLSTVPIIIFWFVFISTSAYNTQVLWYGLAMIRITGAVRNTSSLNG